MRESNCTVSMWLCTEAEQQDKTKACLMFVCMSPFPKSVPTQSGMSKFTKKHQDKSVLASQTNMLKSGRFCPADSYSGFLFLF